MSKKVLVVDDSASIREQLNVVLSEAGFTVIEAVDGVDGLAQIGATTDLALVICDVNMPRMDGIEMIEAARKLSCAATLPIIMLTTEGDPALVLRAKQAGAKGWIVKPFNAARLLTAVKKLVG